MSFHVVCVLVTLYWEGPGLPTVPARFIFFASEAIGGGGNGGGDCGGGGGGGGGGDGGNGGNGGGSGGGDAELVS